MPLMKRGHFRSDLAQLLEVLVGVEIAANDALMQRGHI